MGEKKFWIERVPINGVARIVGRVYVETGYYLNRSVRGTLGRKLGERRGRLPRDVLSSVLRGTHVTERGKIPVYRSAKVTIVFLRVNRRIRFASKLLCSTMGRKMEQNCGRNCLEGSMIDSPMGHKGARSGAPTIVRARVAGKSGIGVALTPGNFNDRGVDHVGVLGPNSKCRKVVSFIIRAMGGNKDGPYPPVIIKIKVNKAFRGTTVLTGGTLLHSVERSGSSSCCTRVRGRLLRGVGDAKVKPRNFNNGAATLKIGIRTFPARVTKVPITIGVDYRIAERLIRVMWGLLRVGGRYYVVCVKTLDSCGGRGRARTCM